MISLVDISLIKTLELLIPSYRVSTDSFGLYRAQSIFQEPSHYCLVLSPAIYISVFNIFTKKRILIGKTKAIIILISVILSASSTGYLSILICMFFLFTIGSKINYKAFYIASSIILALSSYYIFPDLKLRINDLFIGLFIIDTQNLNDINLSSYALVNNINVAYHNFMQNPLIGSGLGSHGFGFEKYAFFVDDTFRQLNRYDAGSLLLRIFSEMGLVGLFCLFFFLKAYRVGYSKSNHPDSKIVIINNSALIYILVTFFRGGNYTALGLPFFIWLYILSFRKNNESNFYKLQKV
tara:strand:- start:82 stop:966 length:885 start_codon:yes stop_codon:yes gene_type:complete